MSAFTYRAVDASGRLLRGELAAASEAELDSRLLQIGLQLAQRRPRQRLGDRLDHPPVQTPVQITALPPYPKAEAVRWNLWINKAIRDRLAALAAERDISPSQLVQELLWQVLTDRRSSTS